MEELYVETSKSLSAWQERTTTPVISGQSVAEWVRSTDPVPYPAAIEAMRTRVAEIRAGAKRTLVWCLEHPPLYTSGTSAKAADLAEPDRFETFDAGRGGQWTYHGPGQLVAYVLLDLTRRSGIVPARDIHAYVTALETWLIATLAVFGVAASRRAGRVGVWVMDDHTGHDNKIAAIGVRVTRWVTWHGVSINVCPNLEHFAGIVPCGIREHGVTSLRALGSTATMDEVEHALRAEWGRVFEPLSFCAASGAATPGTMR